MSQKALVAKRYAKALYEIANQEQITSLVEQELKALVQVITQDSEVQNFIASPNISEKTKLESIHTALQGKVSQPVINMISLLIERGRMEILPELSESFVKIAGKAIGMADALVYTTYLLNDQEQQDVANEFGQLTHQTIRVQNVVDPSLLGGMKVIIGDTLYDGSLAGKLARLEKSFNRQA